jgi:hypothetical protein
MRNFGKSGFMALTVAMLLGTTAVRQVHAKVVLRDVIPWMQVLQDNECLPEDTMMVMGTISVLVTTTIDKNGVEHNTEHMRPVDVGLYSVEWVPDPTPEDPDNGYYIRVGDPWPYNPVGITQYCWKVDWDPLGVIQVYQNNYLLIGKGDLPNYKVHENYLVTVDEDGNFDILLHNVKVTCHQP